VRDELHPEHFGSDLFRFRRGLGELYAAAFAATARVDLSFYNDDVRAELACGCFRLIGRPRDDAAGNRDTIFLQNSFALILVNFHSLAGPDLVGSAATVKYSKEKV
jgi:hypothetical protein